MIYIVTGFCPSTSDNYSINSFTSCSFASQKKPCYTRSIQLPSVKRNSMCTLIMHIIQSTHQKFLALNCEMTISRPHLSLMASALSSSHLCVHCTVWCVTLCTMQYSIIHSRSFFFFCCHLSATRIYLCMCAKPMFMTMEFYGNN